MAVSKDIQKLLRELRAERTAKKKPLALTPLETIRLKHKLWGKIEDGVGVDRTKHLKGTLDNPSLDDLRSIVNDGVNHKYLKSYNLLEDIGKKHGDRFLTFVKEKVVNPSVENLQDLLNHGPDHPYIKNDLEHKVTMDTISGKDARDAAPQGKTQQELANDARRNRLVRDNKAREKAHRNDKYPQVEIDAATREDAKIMRAHNAEVDTPKVEATKATIWDPIDEADLKPEHLDARQHFEYPLKNGIQLTAEERDFYDLYREEFKRKQVLSGNENPSSRPPRIFPDKEFNSYMKHQREFNKGLDIVANEMYPDNSPGKSSFINRFKQSYGHILPKGDRRFAHLSELGSNAMAENWENNKSSKAATTLGDFINGIGKNAQSGDIGMSPESLNQITTILRELESRPDLLPVEEVEKLRKYFSGLPIKTDIISPKGTFTSSITDEWGRIVSPESGNKIAEGDRIIQEALLGSSPSADTADTLRNPLDIDYISRHTEGAPGRMGSKSFQPGGSLALTTPIDDFIEESVRTGTKIDSGELFRFIKDASPNQLSKVLKKYPHIAQQMGHSNPKLLALMAAGAGLTLAALPLVSEANRDALHRNSNQDR